MASTIVQRIPKIELPFVRGFWTRPLSNRGAPSFETTNLRGSSAEWPAPDTYRKAGVPSRGLLKGLCTGSLLCWRSDERNGSGTRICPRGRPWHSDRMAQPDPRSPDQRVDIHFRSEGETVFFDVESRATADAARG